MRALLAIVFLVLAAGCTTKAPTDRGSGKGCLDPNIRAQYGACFRVIDPSSVGAGKTPRRFDCSGDLEDGYHIQVCEGFDPDRQNALEKQLSGS